MSNSQNQIIFNLKNF